MSYSYERIESRRRRAGASSAGGYGASGRRTTFGYWLPLAFTVTVATIGLAAWVWSERKDDEEDSDYAGGPEGYPGGIPPPGYGPPPPGLGGPPGPQMSGGLQGEYAGGYATGEASGYAAGEASFSRSTETEKRVEGDSSFIGKMTGAFRRSPSPQQFFDNASKTVAAGVAAAGAMVGSALGSIREEEKGDFEDHTRWSEEAENRDNGKDLPEVGIKRRGTSDEFFSGAVPMPKGVSLKNRNRRTVAVVVSSVAAGDPYGQHSDFQEHASILSFLPEHVDPDTTRLFVLIYAPDLKQHPLSTVSQPRSTGSMTSSFSNIAHEDAHTPSEQPGISGPLTSLDPNPVDDASPLFKNLYNQALAVVEKDTMIMPFTTPTGHVHLLRHLGPEIVYIQESLCGNEGDVVTHLSGWVRQIVVVVGDEGGHGGLIDSEDEVGLAEQRGEKWWQQEGRTGLGRGVDVVDGLRAGEDWRRRVTGHD